MKNLIRTKTVLITLFMATACATIINGCKVPEEISSKTGAQLWGENCVRCHNAPDPHTYSDDQWDAACEHMRQKAILTDQEITKIRNFLKSSN